MKKMTFHGLAEKILRDVEQPLTANEIWQLAVEKGLDQELNSSGKTPWATLGARLYAISRDNPDSVFKTVGNRPKRFYLKDKKYNINFEEYEAGKTEEETGITTSSAKKSYNEKDLHPFLAHFAFNSLSCYCRTINHSESDKKSYGEWVHPDMIGCVFSIDKWDDSILELSSAMGNTYIKFISFELKKELTLSNLRECFFQTVSNSSWANESYLVASDISKDDDFLAELNRLSNSFGVGVIELNTEDPFASKILFSAESRTYLDWNTLNKLSVMNKGFRDFIKRVRTDLKSNEIRKEKYDTIYDEGKLLQLVEKKSMF